MGEVELRPERVENWISSLPLLNPAETLRKVFTALSTYNRMNLEPALRLQLLELFRYTLGQLSRELQKQYVGLPLPLPDKNKTIAEQNRQIHIEMAFGYKWAVLDAAKAGAAPLPQTQIALAIQRATAYLAETLAISYEAYAPLPVGIWHELHALYWHAEQLGVQDVSIPDRCNLALEHGSAAHTYKQALLLDLADPYHLSARQVDKIFHYLDRWADLAIILPAPKSFDPTCQFLVDLTNDRAGIEYSPDTVIEHPDRYRLLNTVELARKIHAHVTQIRRGEIPDPEGLEANFFRDSHDMLRRLLNVWGLHPKRIFRRSTRIGHDLELAIGIDAINYWINGGGKFVVSSSFVGPMPQRNQLGADQQHIAGESSTDFDFSRWNIIDESAGGFSLAKKGLVKNRVRVGDLVGIRASEQEEWNVAAIRWLRSANPSNIEIGIQRLAPGAESVVIKTLTETGEESDFLPALRLPEIPPLKQPATLVTHAGVHRIGREIYLDNGLRLSRVRIGELLEATGAFERFAFEIVNA